MADLTGKLIADSYKNLLQTSDTNSNGLGSGQFVYIQDGAGRNSTLQISQSGINLTGTIQINGTQLVATAEQLNTAAAGATSVTGIVVESGDSKYGRTLTGTAGVTITNANGTAGNPTFALTQTSVSAGTYGLSQFTVDAYGRITDVTVANTVSANSFVGGTFSGSSLTIENNVSVSGTLDVVGAANIDGKLSVSNDINSTGTLTVAGATSVGGKLTAGNISTSVVSATYLYGDGSNITGLAGAGTMTALTAGTGIHILENATTVTGITGSGTVVINSNQSFGTVSVTTLDVNNNLIVDGSATFVDNAALHFGTDKDLTIQHNGSNSLITDSGTGNLFIQSNEIRLTNTGSFSMLTLTDGQDADFPYGVQVSGTVSATSFVGPTITSINNVIAAVSAVTSVNAAAITSINNAIGGAGYATTSQLAVVSAYATSITEALSATLATSIGNHLPLAGGTMTGAITLPGNPSANLEAATKQYVDNLTAAAIHFHDAVRVESPINLNATYNNGTAGVGATLTNAGTQEALVIDGVTLNTSDRVLVYEQTDATQNGVYTVTDVGSGSTNWVLTRATDADNYAPGTNSGLDEGSYFYVQEGDTGAGEAYVCNTIGTITFGTTNITFIQFSSALVYTAGSGININASRVISVSGVPSSATIAALSATMATSIDNSNTNITTNTNAITSINNVTTSINNVITALSATMATSIDNSNTNITTNTNAITSINSVIGTVSSTLATSIANHLPLSGGTLTGNIVNAVHTASLTGANTPDFSTYNSFVWTLTGDLTLNNPTTEVGGMAGVFVFKQDATGTRLLSLGSEYKTAGGSGITLSTAADAVDVVPYFVEVTGTIYLGAATKAFA